MRAPAPPLSDERCFTHGSGFATVAPDPPTQFGTNTPLRHTWIAEVAVPASTDECSWNTICKGVAAVCAGALTETCWSNSAYPAGVATLVEPSTSCTNPPDGVVTEVVSGSPVDGTAPVDNDPPLPVVPVTPAGAAPSSNSFAVSGTKWSWGTSHRSACTPPTIAGAGVLARRRHDERVEGSVVRHRRDHAVERCARQRQRHALELVLGGHEVQATCALARGEHGRDADGAGVRHRRARPAADLDRRGVGIEHGDGRRAAPRHRRAQSEVARAVRSHSWTGSRRTTEHDHPLVSISRTSAMPEPLGPNVGSREPSGNSRVKPSVVVTRIRSDSSTARLGNSPES